MARKRLLTEVSCCIGDKKSNSRCKRKGKMNSNRKIRGSQRFIKEYFLVEEGKVCSPHYRYFAYQTKTPPTIEKDVVNVFREVGEECSKPRRVSTNLLKPDGMFCVCFFMRFNTWHQDRRIRSDIVKKGNFLTLYMDQIIVDNL